MSHEELEPAEFKYKQHAITIALKPDFDDIRNVQRFLLMKRCIKDAEKKIYEETGASLYGLGNLTNA